MEKYKKLMAVANEQMCMENGTWRNNTWKCADSFVAVKQRQNCAL